MIRRRKFVFMIVTGIVVALVFGVAPLNYIQKLSHGCPISHKVGAKISPCFHDTVTSSFPDLNVIGGPPPFASIGSEEMSVRTVHALYFWGFAANIPVKGPPLRC